MMGTKTDESQLAEMQNSVRTEPSEEVHDAFLSPFHVNSKTESPLSESHQGSPANGECLHKEDQLSTSFGTNQGLISEYRLESNGTTVPDEKQSIDARQIPNNEFKPNTLTSDEKVMLKDSIMNSGHDVPATAVDEAGCLSQDVQLVSFETDMASLGNDRTQDDLMHTTTIPKSVADGDSDELHPEKLAGSVELLDDGSKKN